LVIRRANELSARSRPVSTTLTKTVGTVSNSTGSQPSTVGTSATSASSVAVCRNPITQTRSAAAASGAAPSPAMKIADRRLAAIQGEQREAEQAAAAISGGRIETDSVSFTDFL